MAKQKDVATVLQMCRTKIAEVGKSLTALQDAVVDVEARNRQLEEQVRALTPRAVTDNTAVVVEVVGPDGGES